MDPINQSLGLNCNLNLVQSNTEISPDEIRFRIGEMSRAIRFLEIDFLNEKAIPTEDLESALKDVEELRTYVGSDTQNHVPLLKMKAKLLRWKFMQFGDRSVIEDGLKIMESLGQADHKRALITSSVRISSEREVSDVTDDEGIASAIAKEADVADERLAADRKLTEEVVKAHKSDRLLKAEYEAIEGNFNSIQSFLSRTSQNPIFSRQIYNLCKEAFLQTKNPIWAFHLYYFQFSLIRFKSIPDPMHMLVKNDSLRDVLTLCADLCSLDNDFSSVFRFRDNIPEDLKSKLNLSLDEVYVELSKEEGDSLSPQHAEMLFWAIIKDVDLIFTDQIKNLDFFQKYPLFSHFLTFLSAKQQMSRSETYFSGIEKILNLIEQQGTNCEERRNVLSSWKACKSLIQEQKIDEAEKQLNAIPISYHDNKKHVELSAVIEGKKTGIIQAINMIKEKSDELDIYYNFFLADFCYSGKRLAESVSYYTRIAWDRLPFHTKCRLIEIKIPLSPKNVETDIAKLESAYPENKDVFLLKSIFLTFTMRLFKATDDDMSELEKWIALDPNDKYLKAIKAVHLLREEIHKENPSEFNLSFDITNPHTLTNLVACEEYFCRDQTEQDEIRKRIEYLKSAKVRTCFMLYTSILIVVGYGLLDDFENVRKTYRRMPFPFDRSKVKLLAHYQAVVRKLKFNYGFIRSVFDDWKKDLKDAPDHSSFRTKLGLETLYGAYEASKRPLLERGSKNDDINKKMFEIADEFGETYQDNKINDRYNKLIGLEDEFVSVEDFNALDLYKIDYRIIAFFAMYNFEEFLDWFVASDSESDSFDEKINEALDTIEEKEDEIERDNCSLLKAIIYAYLDKGEDSLTYLRPLLDKNDPTVEVELHFFEILALISKQDYKTAIKIISRYIDYEKVQYELVSLQGLIACLTEDERLKKQFVNGPLLPLEADLLIQGIGPDWNKLEEIMQKRQTYENLGSSFGKALDILFAVMQIKHKNSKTAFKNLSISPQFELFHKKLVTDLKLNKPLSEGLALKRGSTYGEIDKGAVREAEDVTINDMITEFNKIPDIYFNNSLRNKKIIKDKLLERIELFAKYLTSSDSEFTGKYVAAPVDLKQREELFKQLRIYVTHIISKFRQQGDPDLIPDFLISFAYDSAPPKWCVTEASSALAARYSLALNLTTDFSLEESIYNDLDKLKVLILTEVANEDAATNDHQQTNHLIGQYMKWLKETAAVPLLSYTDPFPHPTKYNAKSITEKFEQEFNSKRIAQFLLAEINNGNVKKSAKKSALYLSKIKEVVEARMRQKGNIKYFNIIEELINARTERAKLSPEKEEDVVKYIKISASIFSLTEELNAVLSCQIPNSQLTTYEAAVNKMREDLKDFGESCMSDKGLVELIPMRVEQLEKEKGTALLSLKFNYLEPILEKKNLISFDNEGNQSITVFGVKMILEDFKIFKQKKRTASARLDSNKRAKRARIK